MPPEVVISKSMSDSAKKPGDILYGWDATAGVVSASALEIDGAEYLRLYLRGDKGITTQDRKFEPFLLFGPDEFAGHLDEVQVERLSGNLNYKWIARFPTMKALAKAKARLDKEFKGKYGRVSDEYLMINDGVQQALLLTGVTHFGGFTESGVVRMQLDIETDTTEGFEFPSAGREGDEIIIIALSDSTGREKVISRLEMTEAEMLLELGRTIEEWNPDVIEGHNIFKFDLSYIFERAKRHKVKLGWGRDGSEIRFHKSRVSLAERRFDYPKFEVEGRAFVDTYILVQFYDIVKREMESYSLKEVSKYLGVAASGREYVEGHEIRDVWRSDPKRLVRYAMDDVRETGAIAAMLGAPYFYQSQMLPLAYQDVYVRGNAVKINGLMLRWYLHENHSVPKPSSRADFVVGGFTDVRRFGVIKDVVACDVASLYPSLMLSYKIEPEMDSLGAFLEMLAELRSRRLAAKAMMKETRDASEKKSLDNQQGTFKILINSFFGYLGTDGAYFGDAAAANKITSSGQELIKRIVELLEAEGCGIIEVDTDGVYFAPPREGMADAEIETIIERISSKMPEGIQIEIDGRYPAMLSYKVKNYALLRNDGVIIIKGSGMKSRGLEPFQREFLRRGINYILENEPEKIDAMRDDFAAAITEGRMPVAELAKTDRLQETLDAYREKTAKSSRGRQAGYELAVKSGKEFQPGDYVTYYITGEKPKVAAWQHAKLLSDYDAQNPDVNVAYYLAKLADVYDRVKGFMNSEHGAGEKDGDGELFE